MSVKDFQTKDRYSIDDLVRIVHLLRSKDGCPWDREQTHQSIRNNFIEEVYEAIEAIDTKDNVLLKEELGDVLLQVVFHAVMEEENGGFDFDGVVNDICVKLVTRHPHVFGDVNAENTEQALASWNSMKNTEKQRKTARQDLESVPAVLPALMRTEKLISRARKNHSIELDENILDGMLENQDSDVKDIFKAVYRLKNKGLCAEQLLSEACAEFIDAAQASAEKQK